MLGLILRHELREHLTSLRFAAVLAIALVLTATGALVFSSWYGRALREYSPRPENLPAGMGSRIPLEDLPCRILTVQRAPALMAFCAGAATRELPDRADLFTFGLEAVWRQGSVEGVLAAMPQVDWLWVVAVVLSFGAGVLSFPGIVNERQDGTLSLVLANPVSRGTLLLGKYLASLVALGAALLASLLLGLVTVHLTAPVQLAVDDWLKLGVVALVSLLYLSCFVLLGLCCSAATRQPTIAALAFLLSWAFLVFVVPNLGGVLAGQLRRTDRQVGLQSQGQHEALAERLPYRPGMDQAALASVDLARVQARERALIEFLGELIRQVRLGQHATRISPAAAYTYAVEEITGEGIGSLERFVDHAVQYRRGLLTAVLEADREDPRSEHLYRPGECGVGDRFSHRVADLGATTQFRDPPTTWREGVRAAGPDLVLLVLANGVFFLFVFHRFVRQEVKP